MKRFKDLIPLGTVLLFVLVSCNTASPSGPPRYRKEPSAPVVSFKPPVTYKKVGESPAGVVTGDFNGDGQPDIATADASEPAVTILFNHGDGTFPATLRFTIEEPVHIQGLASADFNGDGHADLTVAVSDSAEVDVFLGNDDGTFITPAEPFAVGKGPADIVAKDFNGDGRPDLAVANSFGDSVSVLLSQ